MIPDLSYCWEGARKKCQDDKWDTKKERKKLGGSSARRLVCSREQYDRLVGGKPRYSPVRRLVCQSNMNAL